VLYALVKNQSLTPTEYLEKSSNKTSKNLLQKSASTLILREALLPFFNNEAELIEMEEKLPLLTIFVRELPLGYFSAETWDVNDETQIPDVALQLTNTNDIAVIGKDSSKYVIEAELTPGFPIVVIKENEMVKLKKGSFSEKEVTFRSLKANKLTRLPANFEFLDDNFDPYLGTNNNQVITGSGVDQVLIDSYNVWEGYASGGWQRDYIYYGLTPNNTRNGITYNY
jgi:hypothetical protein